MTDGTCIFCQRPRVVLMNVCTGCVGVTGQVIKCTHGRGLVPICRECLQGMRFKAPPVKVRRRTFAFSEQMVSPWRWGE